MIIWPIIFGTLGALSLYRGLYHSARYIIENGSLTCSGYRDAVIGKICMPTMQIKPKVIGDDVFSMTNGIVTSIGENYIHIVSHDEPIIIYYYGVIPSVKEGQRVDLGQKVGLSEEQIEFGVTQMLPTDGSNTIKLQPIIPATWLAARGLNPVFKNKGKKSWCEGKQIHVPNQFGCNYMKVATKPPFAIMPITIEKG